MKKNALKTVGILFGAGLLALFLLPAERVEQLEESPSVWEATKELGPLQYEDEDNGNNYAPIGLVAIDYLLGSSLSGDPSGAAKTREYKYENEEEAVEAGREAVRIASRHNYDMASLEELGTTGSMQADGWDERGKQRFVATVHDNNTGERVYLHLLLEHTY